MKKKSFAEMVEASKGVKFSLPHNVKSHKHLLPNGTMSYVFRHDELGELGRILIVPHGTQSQICYEVVGEPGDPMTKKRQAIFEPISKEFAGIMTSICGNGEGTPGPYISPKEKQMIKSMVYPCSTCKTITAMLIFAGDADTKARLEDYARIMYSKIIKLNVPTWIVGIETANIVNGKDLRKSLVLKAHPKRKEASIMTPDQLMDVVDELMKTHCNNKHAKLKCSTL